MTEREREIERVSEREREIGMILCRWGSTLECHLVILGTGTSHALGCAMPEHVHVEVAFMDDVIEKLLLIDDLITINYIHSGIWIYS